MPNIWIKHYLVQKLLSRDIDTDTHRTNCSIWTTKMVGKM